MLSLLLSYALFFLWSGRMYDIPAKERGFSFFCCVLVSFGYSSRLGLGYFVFLHFFFGFNIFPHISLFLSLFSSLKFPKREAQS
jgi:hypothetical protein